jgi:hypothetical protein
MLPALIAYLCRAIPELSMSKLRKLLYLADWKAAIECGHQLTPLEWRFDGLGPHAEDLVDVVLQHEAFQITRWPAAGTMLDIVELRDDAHLPAPSLEEQQILDFVIATANRREWDQLERLVYSTYPVFSSDRYTDLDLVLLAKEYKQELAALDR